MKLKDLLREYVRAQKGFWKDLRDRQEVHHLDRDVAKLYEEVRKEARPIFVLSTGRAGTTLLTRILENSKSLFAVHEPAPELSYHSARAFMKPKEDDGLRTGIDIARYEMIRNAYLLNRRFVETNNRISFFAYYLAELYPQARFIHLVRHPRKFIQSGMARNWYSDKNIYDEGRIKDDQLFEIYTTEQKIAWLWAATNSFIREFTLEHKTQCVSLRSEDLFTAPDLVYQVLQQMEVNDISLKAIRKHIGKLENPTSGNQKQPSLSGVYKINGVQELMEYYAYE